MKRNIDGIKIQLIFILIIIPVVMLTTSCPPPVTPDMVSLVEDELPPTITITSPSGGSNFYSEVTLRGIITDSVLEEGDDSGKITSIYYQIANDSFRKGKIDIGLDDSVVKDDAFGSGDIAYDLTTHEFAITFSTMVPNKFRDQITVSITTIDSNDNVTTETLDLRENDGPYVDFDFFSDATFSEASRITNLNGTEVYLKGSLGNSEYQTDSASEIVKLDWGIFGTFWGGSLDLTEGSGDWVDYLGIYRSLNNDEDYYFDYNPETRTFNTHQSIELDNGMYFYIKATDSYGHVTEVQKLLSPPALLTLSRPTVDFPYYSPDNSATLVVSSKIIDPNDGSLVAADVGTVSYEFLAVNPADTAAVEAIGTTELYNNPTQDSGTFSGFFDSEGAFSFNVDTSSLSGLVGDINVRVIVTDSENTTIPKKSVLLENDSVDPVLSSVSFTDDNSDGYVRRGDGIQLIFTVSDSDSGIKSSSIVSSTTGEVISGTPIETNFTLNPETGQKIVGYYTTSFTVPASAVSDIDGDLIGYNIQVTDNVGNTASVSDADLITFYSPYAASPYSGLNSVSNNAYNSGYVRAASAPTNDRLTLTFTSERVLNTPPDVTIAGRSAVVSYNAGTRACTAYLNMNGTESATDGLTVPLNIVFTDAAGNPSSVNPATAIIYDGTAPAAPLTPTWAGGTYINSTDAASPIPINVYTGNGVGNAAVKTGDTVELYNNSSSGTLLGTAARAVSATVEVSITDASDLGSDGDKNIVSRVVDVSGNRSGDSGQLQVKLDTAVEAVDAGSSYSGATSKTGGFTQNSASATDVYSSITGYSWSFSPAGVTVSDPNVLDVTVTGSSEGTFTGTLTVSDGAGNTASDNFTFVYDLSAPVISGLPVHLDVNDNFDQAATVTDDGAGIDVSTYNWDLTGPQSFLGYDSDDTLNVTTLLSMDDGTYTATLTVSDLVGHEASDSFTFYKDTGAPVINAIADITGFRTTGFSRTASADDGTGSGVDAASYSWSFTPDTVTHTVSSPDTSTVTITNCAADGSYTASVTVDDIAGNTSDPETFTFFWDSTAPVFSPALTDVSSAIDSSVSRTAAPADGTGSGIDTSTYGWSFSGPGTVSATGTDTLSVTITDCSADGLYTATFSVDDNAGLTGSDNFTFYWDTTGPVISHDDPTNEGIHRTDFTHNVTISEPAGASGVDTATINWAIDGPDADSDPDSGFESYSTSEDVAIQIADLSTNGSNDGLYTAICTVDDNLGNTSSASTFTFTVDTAGPTLEVGTDIGWTNNVSRTPPTCSDPSGIASYNWALTGAAAVPNYSAVQTLSVSSSDLTTDGTYIATLTVTDSVGNTSTDSFSFDYDNDLPNTCEAGASWLQASAKNTSFTQDATAADADSGVASASWSFSGANTGGTVDFTQADPADPDITINSCTINDVYTGTLTVTDNAGNFTTDTFQFAWDTAAPTGTNLAGSDLLGANAPDAVTAPGFSRTAGTATDYASGVDYYRWDITAWPMASAPSHGTNIQDTVLNIQNGGTNDVDLATDGSEDGIYTATLTVYDYMVEAGTDLVYTDSFDFLWDCTGPTIDNIPALGDYFAPFSVNAVTTYNAADPTVNSDAGSGISAYDWHVTGPLSFDDTVSGPILYVDDPFNGIDLPNDGSGEGTYNVSLTLTDFAGNSTVETFTFNYYGDGAKAIGSSAAPSLRSGGSSGQGGSASSAAASTGRIRTGSFTSQPTAKASETGLVDTAPNVYSRSSGVSYRGDLYTAGEAPGHRDASEQASASSAETVGAVNTEALKKAPDTAAGTGSGNRNTTVMASSAARASASLTGRITDATGDDTGTGGTSSGSRLWLLLLLLPAAGGVLIFRKRRL